MAGFLDPEKQELENERLQCTQGREEATEKGESQGSAGTKPAQKHSSHWQTQATVLGPLRCQREVSCFMLLLCWNESFFTLYLNYGHAILKSYFFLLESGLYLSGTVPAYHMYGAWFYPQPEPCKENKSNKMEEFCLFCSWTVSSEAKWLSLHHFPGWRC